MIEQIKSLIENSGLSSDFVENHEEGWIVQNDNEDIVGYAGVERRGKNVYIQSLVVDKKYRRSKIGTKLIDKVYDSLNQGDTLIALTLFWNNKFYESCGFERLDAKTIKTQDDVAGRLKHKYCVTWGKRK